MEKCVENVELVVERVLLQELAVYAQMDLFGIL